MSMSDNVSMPIPNKNQMLIQVLACSISPGDVIMVHGNLIFMHAAFPFIPGMDVCGIVQDPNGHDSLFQKGDVIVGANGMSPVGGMAEYMAIDVSEAVLKPNSSSKNGAVNNKNKEGVHALEAAASSSAITARNAVMDHVQKGDRVLILGGSGGVGSAAIQMAKQKAGASFVATTSTQEAFCKELGADQVINYKTENWWEMECFTSANNKFDKIIDCAGGGNFYGRAEKVLKSGKDGGEFIAVTGDDTRPDCRTVWKAVKFFAKMPWRPLYTMIRRGTFAKYVMLMPYDLPKGRAQVLEWMESGDLVIRMEKEYPFTAKGVRDAFSKVGSGHAHGKVVVSMQGNGNQKE
jgi:alcohol dehydrogenase